MFLPAMPPLPSGSTLFGRGFAFEVEFAITHRWLIPVSAFRWHHSIP